MHSKDKIFVINFRNSENSLNIYDSKKYEMHVNKKKSERN